MRVPVTRKNVIFTPDSSRIVARYFMNGDQRTQKMVSHIMTLNEKQVIETLEQTLREFAHWFLLYHGICNRISSYFQSFYR
jgi:hypothetical protein